MTNLMQFVPRPDADVEANLTEFIRFTRDELSVFGGSEKWGNIVWRQDDTVAVFATKLARLKAYTRTPLAQPFMEFAKAYVKYRYSHRPVRSVGQWLSALRCLEAALFSVHGRADISLLNAVVMDVSAEKCRELFPSETSWLKTGLELKIIFDFCRDKRLVNALPAWKSPFRNKPSLVEVLTSEGAAHRAAKVPDNAVMLKLADLFAAAGDDETKFFSSIMILLMVAPGRISEVLRLSTDCIGWEEGERGEQQMFLRWRAGKGKGWTKKWIIPPMQNVVAEAVKRLVDIGVPARKAAKFAYQYPDTFLPHAACLSSPSDDADRQLTADEFCAALSIRPTVSRARPHGSKVLWSQVRPVGKWVKKLIEEGCTTYGELGKHAGRTYRGRWWPYIDAEKSVFVWDALCLHRENEFRKWATPRHFSWRLPSQCEVNVRFTAAYSHSLFERYGLKNEDGSSIRLTTHQPRHWLSTMSERAGMDEFTLARWAGRAHVEHNRCYDHRTPEERVEVLRHLMIDQTPSVIDRFKCMQPVAYQELGVERLGVAKATLYGMCTHDYAMAPCQKQRECMTCSEHVCIKGDHVTLERIQMLEEQTALLLDRATAAHENGVFGADRWVDNHKWKLAHVRAMRMALEQTSVPDGATLRIPDGHDPSPIQRALIQAGLMAVPQIETLKLPVARLASEGDKGA
ncbi:hypothetical protein [Dyella sp.]|uniref:hypothetical protein n=1 Tax=Dyella sp. TaxID=1869338 RepID=UPI002D798531|nr:hypothetical protein [Dyella sp.]HET7332902.1 hypothetical protein [Dyella sp.]